MFQLFFQILKSEKVILLINLCYTMYTNNLSSLTSTTPNKAVQMIVVEMVNKAVSMSFNVSENSLTNLSKLENFSFYYSRYICFFLCKIKLHFCCRMELDNFIKLQFNSSVFFDVKLISIGNNKPVQFLKMFLQISGHSIYKLAKSNEESHSSCKHLHYQNKI